MKVQIFRNGGTHLLGEFEVTTGEPTPQIGDLIKVSLTSDETYWEYGEVYKREWATSPNGTQLNLRIQ